MGRGRGLKFDWQLKFEHAGQSVYVQGEDPDGAAETLIGGNIKQGELGRAELSLLINTLIIIKINGDTAWNRNKGGRQKIPSVPDPARDNLTTADRLLTYIITKRAAHYADKWPDVFEEYYDEEVAAQMELEDETTGAAGKSGSRSGAGATESPEGKAT